ncbi:hypothetical protein LOTGIDRAFT_155722 [Lottia gigantea]|uniref:Uncharacterized protein n=1 Tax=Lottia gigantea TaxID=225164 RepID=V4B2L6_LOTGI|nr:hypothetical protein LOTGIDRAFT_155722 [Lottia gigantea]ESO82704.1 hypothetical protein LOTGIDRAFT_155722 [Lottia gigantea]
MKVPFTTIVALSAVWCLYASAQVFRPRRLSNPGLRSQQQPEYRTCIGQTAAGDEMRVTFYSRRSTSSNWWQSGRITNDIQVKATINSRSLTNKFRLVTTQYGRIDGMCESESLGNIIDENAFTRVANVRIGGQKSRNIGFIGTDFSLSPGKSVRITDHIQSMLNLDIIAGGGMALCPVQQIVGVRCIDLISLCCSISKDTKPADIIEEPGFSGDISGNQFSNVQSEVGNSIVLSNGVSSNAQISNGVIVNPAFNGGQNRITNRNTDGRLVGNGPILNGGNIDAAKDVQNAPMQNTNSMQMGPVQG